MSEQLSRLYQQALKHQRSAESLDAPCLQALAEGGLEGEALEAALDALAVEADAPALLAFAEEAGQQSSWLALELRRADAVARSWSRPRRSRVILAAAAAVAALALMVPLAVMDGGNGVDTAAMPAADMEIDGEVILASSFENGRASDRHPARETRVNGVIFHSRFDG
jgi:hypothetical protein